MSTSTRTSPNVPPPLDDPFFDLFIDQAFDADFTDASFDDGFDWNDFDPWDIADGQQEVKPAPVDPVVPVSSIADPLPIEQEEPLLIDPRELFQLDYPNIDGLGSISVPFDTLPLSPRQIVAPTAPMEPTIVPWIEFSPRLQQVPRKLPSKVQAASSSRRPRKVQTAPRVQQPDLDAATHQDVVHDSILGLHRIGRTAKEISDILVAQGIDNFLPSDISSFLRRIWPAFSPIADIVVQELLDTSMTGGILSTTLLSRVTNCQPYPVSRDALRAIFKDWWHCSLEENDILHLHDVGACAYEIADVLRELAGRERSPWAPSRVCQFLIQRGCTPIRKLPPSTTGGKRTGGMLYNPSPTKRVRIR